MTEPNVVQAMEPGPEPTASGEDVPRDPMHESVAPAHEAWIGTDSSGPTRPSRWRSLVVAVVVIALVAFAVVFPSLGSPKAEGTLVAPGTIAFGTGGAGCTVTGEGSTFPTSAPIRLVINLRHVVQADEHIDAVIRYPDGKVSTRPLPFPPGNSCAGDQGNLELAPGRYVFEARIGSEVLARGVLTVTP